MHGVYFQSAAISCTNTDETYTVRSISKLIAQCYHVNAGYFSRLKIYQVRLYTLRQYLVSMVIMYSIACYSENIPKVKIQFYTVHTKMFNMMHIAHQFYGITLLMTSSFSKYFRRYWPFVWGLHRSSVNSPHKGQ